MAANAWDEVRIIRVKRKHLDLEWLTFNDVPGTDVIEDRCAVGVGHGEGGLHFRNGSAVGHTQRHVVRAGLCIPRRPREHTGVWIEIGAARQDRAEVRELVALIVARLQAERQRIAFAQRVIRDGF